jgi:hypothetical protein
VVEWLLSAGLAASAARAQPSEAKTGAKIRTTDIGGSEWMIVWKDRETPGQLSSYAARVGAVCVAVLIVTACSGHSSPTNATPAPVSPTGATRTDAPPAAGGSSVTSPAPTASGSVTATTLAGATPVGSGGGSGTSAPPQVNEPTGAGTKPANPCALVTKSEAQTIVGTPIVDPQEAAQGPTCIYQTPDSTTFITLAVQATAFAQIQPLVKNIVPVTGLGHEAYCGDYGKPTLFVLVSSGKLLTVTASCATAEQFATKALPRL